MEKSTNVPKIRKIEMLHIFVTDRCNMRCPHCYVDSKSRFDDELSTDEMKRLFDDLNKIHFTDGIHLEGGEPFLRKDLVEFLTQLDNLSPVTIATNGTIPFDSKFKAIKGIQRIGFSVEGASQDIHNKLRPNNLKDLRENMMSFKKHGFDIQSRTTLTSQNFHEIELIVQKNHDLGIPIARFSAFTPVGRGKDNLSFGLDMAQYQRAIDNYFQAVKKYSDKMLIKFTLPTSVAEELIISKYQDICDIQKSSCYKGCDQLAISANGDVFQCYNLLNFKDNKLGNIRERSFLDIISDKRCFEKGICPNTSCASAGIGTTSLINRSKISLSSS